ncbi:SRPBCC domain-containing protein [Variovorax dokdonensis]|uniref:SRPBCC domain-containing protein n=1 Tax=Variovorax dokdonensis TaxID=344883 RepID=A0ABT7N994_9BURK|nr:SRPBCC domain-containing protein [Variovorax dokdonensis]
MKAELQFDFVVGDDKRTLVIKREFAAKRQLVWDCHTKSELLDQWFAPKPLTAKTKFMDFKEGGHWLYAMVEPNGTEYWGRTDFQTIHPIDNYTALDGFCDSNGTLNPELPRAEWDVTFSDLGAHTLVQTVARYASPQALEQVMQMGMKDGMTSTMERLDELLLVIAPR